MAKVLFSKLLDDKFLVNNGETKITYRFLCTKQEKVVEVPLGARVVEVRFDTYGLRVQMCRLTEKDPISMVEMDFAHLATRSNVVAAFIGRVSRMEELIDLNDLLDAVGKLREKQARAFELETLKHLSKKVYKSPQPKEVRS